MNKLKYLLLSALFFIGLFILFPKSASAQCSSSTCVSVLTEHVYNCTPPDSLYIQQCTEYTWRCIYPMADGGNCTCCFLDQCLVTCTAHSTPPPSNGDPAPWCGDGTCNGSETCSNCPASNGGDCGCPTGDVNIKAVAVASGTNSCAEVNASTTYIADDITLYPPGITKTTPVNGSYASWANQSITSPYTTYTFADTPPNGYVYKLACWSRDLPGAISGSGAAADLYDGSTLTWTVGYTVGAPWYQAQGGDVYAATTTHSYVPYATLPRYFVKDGSGGSPGTVTYGETANTPYDFDSNTTGFGETWVSSQKWLANETYTPADYYAIMFHRFGSPTAADNTGPTSWDSAPTLAPLNGQAYYVNGDLTLDTNNWTVGTGESIVVLVNGNLTINTEVHITGTGFVAFIANGDITVGSSVGAAAASTTSVLDGVYITSPTGTFHTGASTAVATRKFIGKGTFVAGDFAFERDLDADGQNNNYPSELFIYNPQLLVTMPDAMRDLPITWQEVAP